MIPHLRPLWSCESFPQWPRFLPRGSGDLRVTVIVLILLNLVLGAGLLASTRNDATRATRFADCCLGDGEEAYCCFSCCWFWSDCDTNSDCRDA